MRKFLAAKTIETFQGEPHEALSFPAVAVCPGFKRRQDGSYHGVPSDSQVDPFPNEVMDMR